MNIDYVLQNATSVSHFPMTYRLNSVPILYSKADQRSLFFCYEWRGPAKCPLFRCCHGCRGMTGFWKDQI